MFSDQKFLLSPSVFFVRNSSWTIDALHGACSRVPNDKHFKEQSSMLAELWDCPNYGAWNTLLHDCHGRHLRRYPKEPSGDELVRPIAYLQTIIPNRAASHLKIVPEKLYCYSSQSECFLIHCADRNKLWRSDCMEVALSGPTTKLER